MDLNKNVISLTYFNLSREIESYNLVHKFHFTKPVNSYYACTISGRFASVNTGALLNKLMENKQTDCIYAKIILKSLQIKFEVKSNGNST